MGFRLDSSFERTFRRQNRRILKGMATEAATFLAVALDEHPVTGIHWPFNPNPSSAPGEYPQYQTGDLQGGVGLEFLADELTALIFVEDDFEKLLELEFNPESEGGRHFMQKFMMDTAMHREILHAAETS